MVAVSESYTIQNYLMQTPPDNEAIRRQAHEQFEFLKYVVAQEGYTTGLRQQRGLMTGAMPHVMFGRNEGGGQHFHSWADKIIETEDQELPALFVNN
ncbi:MAG: SRPBCC family protein [Pseudomonadales bacterium]|nr:SRPBCC family protein [Pseudomonadales bacterium]MDP6472328.1 SRPBCC family protein [Pseudomonadales bacterium]MDP6828124.1 SRPBCC family protein [Pseudomonadales bacterium]MDP6971822.1 SRPBCC family protein [Pseudomonadales bacterium]